jgi:glutamyl-tRNA reductase
VRVRQLAAGPAGAAYAELIRELFELDPASANVADIPEVLA